VRIVSRVLVVAVLLLLTSCTGDDREPRAADPTPEATAPAGTDPDDERYLQDAVQALLVDDQVDFGFSHRMVGRDYFVGSGTAALGPERWAATGRFDGSGFGQGENSFRMNVRSFRTGLWMQMEEWPEPQRGCWLELEPGQVPVTILAMRPGQPVYLSALAALEPGPRSGNRMTADLTLDQAINLLPGRIAERITMDPADARTTTAPVEVVFRYDVVSSMTLQGAALLEALDEAGSGIKDSDMAALAATYSVRVQYFLPSGAEPEYRPATSAVFRVGEEGC
jgi:hypothetical protein